MHCIFFHFFYPFPSNYHSGLVSERVFLYPDIYLHLFFLCSLLHILNIFLPSFVFLLFGMRGRVGVCNKYLLNRLVFLMAPRPDYSILGRLPSELFKYFLILLCSRKEGMARGSLVGKELLHRLHFNAFALLLH